MSNKFGNLCVLVVDDSALMRNLLQVMLDNLGIGRVLVCANGDQALQCLHTETIDIVFCDWKMEPMDGITLVEHIRDTSTSPAPRIPVIMISGFGDEFPVKQGLDAGMTDFIAKPLSAQALYQRLAGFVEDPDMFVHTVSD